MAALGVGLTISSRDKELFVDPEMNEEEGEAIAAIGIMPALGKISGLWFSGEIEVEDACEVSPIFTVFDGV